MTTYIGIDIGGSFIKYGLVDPKGQVRSVAKVKTPRENPEQVVRLLKNIIEELKQASSVVGVGISLPGVINQANQLITSGALTDLYRLPVAQELEQAAQLPVRLVNDANAIAYAEKWIGAAQKSQYFVCLPIGTGVGGSIFVNGDVLKGQTGAAGEFGMMLMNYGQTEPLAYETVSLQCGAVGGLCRFYNQKTTQAPFSEWEKDIQTILARAEAGEEAAQASLAEFYQNTAVLLLNIRVSLDPQDIFIGGGISENKGMMQGITTALESLQKRYPEIAAIGFPKVQPCQLGNQAGMIGAVSQFIKGE